MAGNMKWDLFFKKGCNDQTSGTEQSCLLGAMLNQKQISILEPNLSWNQVFRDENITSLWGERIEEEIFKQISLIVSQA